MARASASLREQAARLFALALKARERGDVDQADLLIAAGSRCIDRAIEAEAAEAQAAGIPPRQPQPRPAEAPAQQQQQEQPPQKDEENSPD